MRKLAAIVVAIVIIIAAARLAFVSAGRALLRSDPLARADLIVVLGSGRLERTLEAGTLIREGWASRILLMHPPDAPRRSLLHELGVEVPSFYETQRSALTQMGVASTAIAELPGASTTSEEARAIVSFARAHGYKRVLVVTSPYHTRRSGSIIRGIAKGSPTVIIRANRYERVDPGRWWQRPGDRADVAFEYLKTAYAIGSF